MSWTGGEERRGVGAGGGLRIEGEGFSMFWSSGVGWEWGRSWLGRGMGGEEYCLFGKNNYGGFRACMKDLWLLSVEHPLYI